MRRARSPAPHPQARLLNQRADCDQPRPAKEPAPRARKFTARTPRRLTAVSPRLKRADERVCRGTSTPQQAPSHKGSRECRRPVGAKMAPAEHSRRGREQLPGGAALHAKA
eukprot:scaffold544_cov117-Isochrysis_galbana.AAC.29